MTTADSQMSFTQEEVQALCYQPYWYNVSLEDKISLEYILEDYIQMKNDDDSLDVDDAKCLLEIIKNPIFKKYKDVIHCGVN